MHSICCVLHRRVMYIPVLLMQRLLLLTIDNVFQRCLIVTLSIERWTRFRDVSVIVFKRFVLHSEQLLPFLTAKSDAIKQLTRNRFVSSRHHLTVIKWTIWALLHLHRMYGITFLGMIIRSNCVIICIQPNKYHPFFFKLNYCLLNCVNTLSFWMAFKVCE